MARVTFSPSATDNETVTGQITAATQYIGPYRYRKGDPLDAFFQLQIGGTWSATLQLQTSIPDRNEWTTTDTHTANISQSIGYSGSVDVRLYCSAHTSGTVVAGLINR